MREKAMKKWLRKWKLDIIEKMNPQWNDPAARIIGERPFRHYCHRCRYSCPCRRSCPCRHSRLSSFPLLSVIPANAGIQPHPTRSV